MIKITLMVIVQDNFIFLPDTDNLAEIMSKPGQIIQITVPVTIAEKLIKGEKIPVERM